MRPKKIIRWVALSFYVMILVVLNIPFLDTPHAKATTQTFTSSTSWQAPAGISSVQAEVWGAGGGGGGQNDNADGGGGGGGGAYSLKANISVTPLSYYTVTVGTGGTGGTGCSGATDGGDSWFSTTGTVFAEGGKYGYCSTGTPPPGGVGGSSGNGVGDTLYSGGQGEPGRDSNAGKGGYGGSSAGTASDGFSGDNPWTTETYPTGSTPTGAGHGGDGGSNGSNGSAPVSGYGGGGGGAGEGSNMVGGNGYDGKVTLTWDTPLSVTVSDGIVSYGYLDTSATEDTTSGGSIDNTQVATNESSVAVDFNIMGQDSANWTLASSPGSEQYAHSFCTSGAGSPDPCDSTPSWTPLTTGYQTLATNVSASGTQRFDLQIEMPTSTSNYSQQSVTVTVQVVEYVP